MPLSSGVSLTEQSSVGLLINLTQIYSVELVMVGEDNVSKGEHPIFPSLEMAFVPSTCLLGGSYILERVGWSDSTETLWGWVGGVLPVDCLALMESFEHTKVAESFMCFTKVAKLRSD